MSSFAIFRQLRDVSLPLENIYLDPNNPRFAEFNSPYVLDSEIEAAQERVTDLMVSRFDVEKVCMNMEVNGYIPVDRVIVREFADGKYVVLEGNRRISAAKRTLAKAAKDTSFSEEVLSSLKKIPCLLYLGHESNAAWIFQGLRHITGINEWSSFNKAKLLVEQMEEENLTLTQVGRHFGLSAHGAGQWVRGYYAFKQAREQSEYWNEIDERSYPYFLELFGPSSSAVRTWLKWDDTEYLFKDALNFNEFVGWLYPRSDEEEDEKGDWEHRRISRRDDIRIIARLITRMPKAFDEFRQGVPLDTAFTIAQARQYEADTKKTADRTQEAFEAIQILKQALDNLPHKAIRDKETLLKLQREIAELQTAIASLELNKAT